MITNPQGLSDEEIARLAALPRRTKEEMFGTAERFYKKKRHELEHRAYRPCSLLINSADGTWVRGHNYKDAFKVYDWAHGPTPIEGRYFLSIIVPAY
jgi:hypothetical protein